MKEINQLMLDLKRKIFKPVYFLSGEEPYFIDLVSDFFEHQALEESEKEFNQDVVYGKDVDLVTVLSLAKQFPMMSDYKIVLVKEAQNMKELDKSGSKEEDGESESAKPASGAIAQLTAYVQNPLKSTVLVFCYKYKKLDKRSALAKALQKHTVFIETKKLYDNKLPDWITEYAKEKKVQIHPRAAALMAEYIGNDLSRLANEVDKLLIGLEPGKEISTELVQDKIGINREFNIFELQVALGNRDILKANRIANYFAANEKENPLIGTTAMLYSFFAKIYRYHGLQDKSKGSVASVLGINPFFVDQYANAARTFPPEKMPYVFTYLRECDLKSKGIGNSGIENGELLKELIFKLLH